MSDLRLRSFLWRAAGWGTALALALTAARAAGAEDTSVPRFESIKADPANMREGPSTQNRVKWVYHRKGLPVEVLDDYDVWRRVRVPDGTVGWMHVALLSPNRTALIVGHGVAAVRAEPKNGSRVVARAQPGAIGRLERCGAAACELDFSGTEGWVSRTRLWGVHIHKPQGPKGGPAANDGSDARR